MQAQLDAQNKAIEDTQSQIASTQGDLNNTRTELTGSIARTHDELVLLEKKGERNYYEFDIDKSKQFQHDGPFGVRLRKANTKHQYADLELMVDDRNLSQKHVNLYQPVMFYTPDNPQPVELVINRLRRTTFTDTSARRATVSRSWLRCRMPTPTRNAGNAAG